MRIWSIHPQYLDAKGLVALWRETLLAQNVLLKNTRGYKNHPQLTRFKEHKSPNNAISNYLHAVCDEADNRGYNFNRTKIANPKKQNLSIKVTSGQMDYEWQHLLRKIEKRDNKLFLLQKDYKKIKPHPLFVVVKGNIESWEKVPKDPFNG